MDLKKKLLGITTGRIGRALPALVFALTTFPVSAADDGETDGKRFRVDGYSSTSYVLRSTRSSGDNYTDSDLFERIRLDITSQDNNKYEFHLFGTLKIDMDGDQDWQAFYPFESIDDTRDSRTAVYVYDAYAVFNEILPHIKQVRVGRQSGKRDELVFFDGVAGDIELPGDVNVSVYGGRPVHFYEEDAGSDALIGIGIDYSLTPRTELSGDYLYADDERDFLTDEQNSLVALKVQQLIGRHWKTMVRYRMIDGEERDITFRSITSVPDTDLMFNIGYFSQLRSQRELSNEFSLYHDIMGVSEPYHNLDLNIRKLIGEHHAFNAGFVMRRLQNSDNEGSFNREYDRIFVTYEAYDLPCEGMTVGVTGERWRSSSDVDSFGLDIGYDGLKTWKRDLKLNVGTYYSLYKYDYYFDPNEKSDVNTYYIKGKIPLKENLTGSLAYEYEDAGDNTHILRAELKYAF